MTHRSTRIFVLVLALIVIALSAFFAYLYVESAEEGREVPEEIRSEETLETGPEAATGTWNRETS